MPIHGNEIKPDQINMAKDIFTVTAENSAKLPRGRQLAIDDGRLFGVRDHLVWLLESTWPDVGGGLSTIKNPADVCAALQIWEQRSHEYTAQLLLRPSSSPATAKVLNERRRRLGELNETVRNAHEFLEKSWESFERAMRIIPVTQLSQNEQKVIDDAIRKRAEVLAHAGTELLTFRDRQAQLERILRDGEAYFARAEFVRFLRSDRYEIRPLNIANALAGLPYIGWRQSAKRCQGQVCTGANGGAIQIFETIRRIVQSCTRKSELNRHAEQWLRAQGHTESFGVSELRKDWFYLRWSIKTVLESGARRRDLPYAIARQYWKRKSTPSNVDLFFAEEEALRI